MGRKSTFTEKIAAEICERLSRGEPLAVICRDEHMPAVSTVSDWKQEHKAFSVAFARARLDGFDALAAQCLEISDDETHDWLMTRKGAITNEVAIGRAKLQVETRLKLLAKWYPTRYGDRTHMELTGAGGGPVQVDGTLVASRTAALLAAAQARRQASEDDQAEGGE